MLPIITFSDPPVAPQKGNTTNPIDTGDARMENAVFRDGLLWGTGSAACKPPGDSTTRSCLQFLEVLTAGATPTLNQDFIFGTKNLYDYYPSVDLDNFDDIVTSVTQSSSTEFPSAYLDGRLQTDSLDTLGTPVLIRAGAAATTVQILRPQPTRSRGATIQELALIPPIKLRSGLRPNMRRAR